MKDFDGSGGVFRGCNSKKYYMRGTDSEGTQYAKKIDCGRPWCSSKDCQDHSQMRRVSRCLPKARKIYSMFHMVVTFPRFPIDLRPWTPSDLEKARVALTNALEMIGIKRFMFKLHAQGEKHPDVYHPHFDIIGEGGYLDSETLAYLLDTIRYQLRLPWDSQIKYKFSTEPGKKYNWLKYMNKNTFLNPDVNLELAENWSKVQTFTSRGAVRLYRDEWGADKNGKIYQKYTVGWSGKDQWGLDGDVESEEKLRYARKIMIGISPVVAVEEKITWYGKPVDEGFLLDNGYTKIWNGIYQVNPPDEAIEAYLELEFLAEAHRESDRASPEPEFSGARI